jgi:repressor LexA
MTALTPKQYRVFLFIEKYIRDNGFSPSVRDIAKQFDMGEKGAYDHMNALRKKNKITWVKNTARSIRIVEVKNS